MNNIVDAEYWAEEEIYDSAQLYFQRLLEDISLSQRSIVLESYVFKKDLIGNNVVRELQIAARRGVSIKVLIDGVGSFEDAAVIANELSSCGVEVRIFHPLPWRIDLYRLALTKKIWYAKLPYFLVQLNRRDHRKLCVIDGEIAWVGSFNINDSHFPESMGGKNLTDIGVRLQGYSVRRLLDDFCQIWFNKIYTGKLRRINYYLSNAGENARNRRNLYLLNKLKYAKSRIWIFSAYFSPTKSLLGALIDAKNNGADVKLLVASESDIIFFSAITRTYYKKLLDSGIEVFEYTKGILHSKTILIDEICYLGSANMNHRSYFHDLELDVVLTKEESVNYFGEKFSRDIKDGLKIDARYLNRMPLLSRLLGKFLLIFRSWL